VALGGSAFLAEEGEAGPLGAQPLPRLLERAEPPRSHRFPCSLFTPRRRGEVSFGLDYHDGPPVFLCCAMGPLVGGAPPHDAPAPPLSCVRLDERGATLSCGGGANDAGAPAEQAGWLALPTGKLWALETYDDGTGSRPSITPP
jgi:hypothetical protein